MDKNELRKFEGETVEGYKIVVYHNLPEIFGLDIDNVFGVFQFKSAKYTSEEFVKYVNSKKTGYDIMTEEQYNKL